MENVTEDCIKCADCEKWCHIEGCTDVVSPNDFLSKPYSCKKCSEKGGGKAKKSKDSAKGNRKAGRPRKRERSHSIPNYLTVEDWIANRDRIAKNIGSKIKKTKET